jgi:phospholipid transport system substrate-binding protein
MGLKHLVKLWLLMLCFVGSPTWAAGSPMEMIRSTINQVTTVLGDPANQGEQRRQARIEKVWQIVAPHFDMQELAQRALGTHWRERTENEKQEFVQLFTTLIEKTYGDTLSRYNNDVQFFFDRERIDGDSAEVDTRLINPSLNKTVPITYQLHQVGGDWRIYDVVIENVSLVRNYRNQFNRILSHSSYQDLVQDIKRKIQELAASPSAPAKG